MSKETRKIIARIEALEQEKVKLLNLRKEEIFNILQRHQGLTLDNRLLAGLAMYVKDPANADSELLKQLMELGKNSSPRLR